jgi:hypothetical protein
MDTFLPEGFEPGRARPAMSRPARAAQLSVEAGGIIYPVLRRWATGFAVSALDVPKLDGMVNLFEGAQHLRECLITGRELRDDEQVFTVKHATGYDYAATGDSDLGAQASA